MSTILEALRELEGKPAPPAQQPPPWNDGSRRLGILAAIAAITLVAGSVLLVVALRLGPAGRGATAPPDVDRTPPPAAAAPRPRVPGAPAERPWGRVQTKPSASAEPPHAERPPPPPRVAAVRPAEPPAPAPDRSVTRIIGAPHLPPPRAATEPPPQPVGAPQVRVTALSYAANRGDRAVSLAIDSAYPVVLHEGEAAGGVEVQLILPDRVYVRSGPNVFAVDATP